MNAQQMLKSILKSTNQHIFPVNQERNKVFVGCIPGDINELELNTFFNFLGNVEYINLHYKNAVVNAGYCIVTCLDQETFRKLLEYPVIFKNRKLECRPYLERSELEGYKKVYNQRRIYIYNVLRITTDSQIKELFERNIGPVENAYCIRKQFQAKEKKKVMFGYVLFRRQEDARKAVEMGSLNFRGQIIKVKEFMEKVGKSDKSFEENKKNSEQRERVIFHPTMPELNVQSEPFDLESIVPIQSQNFRNGIYLPQQNQRILSFENLDLDQNCNEGEIERENMETKKKSLVSNICFELLSDILRNHDPWNLRYNW